MIGSVGSIAGHRFPRVSTDPFFQTAIPEDSRPVTVSTSRKPMNGFTGGMARRGGEPLPQRHQAWSSKTDSFGDPRGTPDEDDRDIHSPRGIKPHFIIGDGAESPVGGGLPSISPPSEPSPRKKSGQLFSRTGSAKRKGLQIRNNSCEIPTHLPLDAIASEVVRVVSNLQSATDLQMKGNTLFYKFPHITLSISLCKQLPNLCHVQFERLSGTDHKKYQEICQHVLDSLEV